MFAFILLIYLFSWQGKFERQDKPRFGSLQNTDNFCLRSEESNLSLIGRISSLFGVLNLFCSATLTQSH